VNVLSRIVWSEGMHLAQHHFQLQSAYFEQIAGAAMSNLVAAPYGMLGCEFDESALLNDSVVIGRAWGIMPDGTPFSFPDEPAPEPLALGDAFSPTRSWHLVLLAIPAAQSGRANCDLSGSNGISNSSLRFSVSEREIPDETTGGDPRPVKLARKNFRLVLDSDVSDGLVTLPIARVQRDGSGHFAIDHRWVGPCLRISASPRLRDLVGRMTQMLEERAAAIVAERRASAGAAEYAPREVVSFWFLHAVNTALPELRHHQRTGLAHPEQLYLSLSQLAGALCTFSLTSTPRDLPTYDHDAPEESFTTLERHIREHLDVMLPANAISLSVRATEPSFYAAPIADARCMDPRAHWYLGVRSSAPAADVIARAALDQDLLKQIYCKAREGSLSRPVDRARRCSAAGDLAATGLALLRRAAGRAVLEVDRRDARGRSVRAGGAARRGARVKNRSRSTRLKTAFDF
jgi:type VI secretion system protein ImpJ